MKSKIRGQIKYNHNLAKHNSWRIGGPARIFYQPADLDDLKTYLQNLPKNERIVWLGSGTNVLINSNGIDANVIYLKNRLTQLQHLDNGIIRVEAGTSCTRLVQNCIHRGMIDAAFLAGIPGTVGGAIAMNAGAYGDNIWNHVISVETIDRNGKIKIRQAKEFKANYREINGLDINNEWFIAANLALQIKDPIAAKNRVTELLAKRKATQPLNEFTCGSVFRNPANNYAAKLIEDCGLKGFKIGAARVSEKHANFIVNEGNATSDDVQELMQKITNEVKKKYGIKLLSEVHFYL